MKRWNGALLLVTLTAVVSLTLVPALQAQGQDPAPRGIWCNTAAVLSLPNPDAGSGVPPAPQFVTEPPFSAVNLEIDQGKALVASALVNPGYLLPFLGGSWFGAFCPGFQSPRLVGVTIAPVLGSNGNPVLVNNLGEQIPGDPGAIYRLVTAK
jgi:hypothetical protein